MRSSRHVVLSLAAMTALALTPSAGAAQSATQGFADSWYWGAYGGISYFSTTGAAGQNLHNSAPSVGVDWMLTRAKFALNIFADQSYFTAASSVLSPTGAGALPVNLSDMRRFGFAAMFFTPDIREFKPYVGLGYSFNFINSASLQGAPSFPTQAAADSNQRAMVDARAMGKVFANVGVMLIAKRFAPFVQYTIMPTQGASDWLVNGSGFTTILAVGLRYNFGTSIEKW